MIKFKVKIKHEKKTLTREFTSDSPITLSADDEVVKKAVSETLREFGESPERMSVSATLIL